MSKRPYFLACLLLAISACKSNDDNADTWKKQVRLEWMLPQENKHFGLGDTVIIAASISSAVELHGYTLEVMRTDSAVSYSKLNRFRHVHGKELLLHELLICDSLGAGSFELWLRLHADHQEATMELNRKIWIQP